MKKSFLLMLPIVFLTMLVFLFNSSYAVYSTSATGNPNINSSAWIVYVNDTDMVQNGFITIDTNDIEIDNTNAHAMDGVIAPGSVITIPLVIDGSDAEVPVDYVVEIGDPYYNSGDILVGNENPQSNDISDAFSISLASGSLTGTINQTSNNTTANIEIELEWNKASDSTSNSRDMSMESQTIIIPFTVTASQHITTPSP